MESLISNFVLMIFVCLSFKQVSALRCYDCHNLPTPSNTVDACKKLQPSMIKTCPPSDSLNTYVCRTFTFQPKDSNFTYEVRSCEKLQLDNILEYNGANNERRLVNAGAQFTSFICNKDLCNSAVNNPSTKLILFISAVLSLSLYKY